ncbi:MAG: succinylglutamate desuccinylase/aspartoacylase family protein [Saprospiraceae bacterium]|nr:succinylglutamate desuccinylase/aspartoacylase family protein [Saprospiraceae bacterium]MBK9221236.1 succinylglutamate desuccinylase/aspartoacylase family protein [Saprospiraceae bacterium]
MSSFNLQGQEFPLGSSGLVRINAGKLPSGNRISIFTYIFRSKNPGPTVLFLGGMHGDEINGVEIIRKAIASHLFSQLNAGTVIAIPLLNIFGFINFSRDVPDGKDVNRSFPGTGSGSLASRIAKIITRKILPLVDFGVDFHTGGEQHYNYPQLRFSSKHDEARLLALKSNFDLLVEKPVVGKSMRKIAKDLKIPILVYEGGESNKLDAFAIQNGIDLIKDILSAHQMLKTGTKNQVVKKLFKKTSWERAQEGGIVTYKREAGVYIYKGELLAIISDPFAQREIRMHASRDGFILSHNNAPLVNVGDGMFHFAFEEERYASII